MLRRRGRLRRQGSMALRTMCVPCAALAALALSVCRIYGTLAPLRSPRGSCSASASTAASAECLQTDTDGEDVSGGQWVLVLPAVQMDADDGAVYSCEVDIIVRTPQACCQALAGWVPGGGPRSSQCDGNSSGHAAPRECWYRPWRKDGGTLSGLLFGRARLDGCDVVGDDRDTWDACVLYILVAVALAGYVATFCWRACRSQDEDDGAGPLLRAGRFDGGEGGGEAARVYGVVEPAPDGVTGYYPCGTPRDQHCCVCLEEELCVVFDPCMHLATCAACATSLRACPICRRPIARRLGIDPAQRRRPAAGGACSPAPPAARAASPPGGSAGPGSPGSPFAGFATARAASPGGGAGSPDSPFTQFAKARAALAAGLLAAAPPPPASPHGGAGAGAASSPPPAPAEPPGAGESAGVDPAGPNQTGPDSPHRHEPS